MTSHSQGKGKKWTYFAFSREGGKMDMLVSNASGVHLAVSRHLAKQSSLHAVNIQSTLQSTLENMGKNTVYIKNE